MSLQSGNVRSPLPDSGEKVWPNSAGNFRIRLDPDYFGQIRQESSGSSTINGRIRSYPAGSSQIRPDPVGSGGRHQASVAGFRCRQDASDRRLSDSDAGWIPTIDNCKILTIGYQTCV
jgi:hypothetical protein